MRFDQQAGGVLVGRANELADVAAVLDAVLVLPVVVFDTDVELFLAPLKRLAQVVLDLWVEVQVGVVVATAVAVVVHHPVHETVDENVRFADGDGVAPHRGDLPDVAAGAAAVGGAQVGIELEVIEAGDVQVDRRADQVGLDVVFTEPVGGGDQHVLDRPEGEVGTGDLAQREARAEFAIEGMAVTRAVGGLGVVLDHLYGQEQVTEAPAARVLEGDGLLDFRVDLEILAVEVGQAVVLPLHQVTGNGLAACQQTAGQCQRRESAIHGSSWWLRRVVMVFCLPFMAVALAEPTSKVAPGGFKPVRLVRLVLLEQKRCQFS
nr:MutT-like protein [Pseudomonas sp. ADP]